MLSFAKIIDQWVRNKVHHTHPDCVILSAHVKKRRNRPEAASLKPILSRFSTGSQKAAGKS